MEDKTTKTAGDWKMIEAQLPPNYKEIAKSLNLIKPHLPAHIGAKIKDISVPLRLLLYRVGTDQSLRTAMATACAADLVDMSPVALHKWERKLGPYIAELLKEMTGSARTFGRERWAGYDMITVDATTVSRPGSDGTTARVHYALRLSTLQPVHIEVTDETGGETYRRFTPVEGQLWLGDRGYANPPGIAHIVSYGADVLVRFNRGSLPLYDVDGDPIDVQEKVAKLKKPLEAREWAAWVYPEGKNKDGKPVKPPIRGRLVALRLPAHKAKEARARLHREQGDKVTPESLRMADFVIVFTTVPKNKLDAERVLELYRLRWQQELHIKRDKSIAGLGKLPNFRNDTIYTWLCAKMLLTQVARKIANGNIAFSPGGEWLLERRRRRRAA